MTASWEQTQLPTILLRYELRDTSYVDEFGLYYQHLPTKSCHLKGERCARGKFSQIRLTGLAAGNGVGEKLPMLLIGKAEKPRYFKGVETYLVSTSPNRNPGWTLKFFLIM